MRLINELQLLSSRLLIFFSFFFCLFEMKQKPAYRLLINLVCWMRLIVFSISLTFHEKWTKSGRRRKKDKSDNRFSFVTSLICVATWHIHCQPRVVTKSLIRQSLFAINQFSFYYIHATYQRILLWHANDVS